MIYNLWLRARYIRKERPDVRSPFSTTRPSRPQTSFSILPLRDEILDSLLCCDLVGFHIPRLRQQTSPARAVSLRRVKRVDPCRSPRSSAVTAAPWPNRCCSLPDAMKAGACASSPRRWANLPRSDPPALLQSEICAMSKQISEQHFRRSDSLRLPGWITPRATRRCCSPTSVCWRPTNLRTAR